MHQLSFFSVEQESVPEVNRGFTGHIMVGLEHGVEDGAGGFLKTGAEIRGLYAYGKPYVGQAVVTGQFSEEPSFFEKPLGRTVIDCIENEYPIKTISILKCGANPAQMIRSTRRAIISEAESRGFSPEMMGRVEGVMRSIRLNVVDRSRNIGQYDLQVGSRTLKGLFDLSETDTIYVGELGKRASEVYRLNPLQARQFVENGDCPVGDEEFMKTYSIAKDIPEGEGEEMAVLEAADMALALFLLEKDALKDKWKDSFVERCFTEKERLLLEKIKSQVMARLHLSEDVEIAEFQENFLLANRGQTLFVHPIFFNYFESVDRNRGRKRIGVIFIYRK